MKHYHEAKKLGHLRADAPAPYLARRVTELVLAVERAAALLYMAELSTNANEPARMRFEALTILEGARSQGPLIVEPS